MQIGMPEVNRRKLREARLECTTLFLQNVYRNLEELSFKESKKLYIGYDEKSISNYSEIPIPNSRIICNN